MKPIRLETALETELVGISDWIDYPLQDNEVELTKEQTGWEKKQILHTELGLKWRLDRLKNGRFILVANGVTKQKINFEGKIGHDEGPNTMNYACKGLYFNRELATEVVTMDKDIFNQLDECNKKSPRRSYWLGSPSVFTLTGHASFGLHYIRSDYVSYIGLCRSDGTTVTGCYGVRPVVFLKSDLMVVAGAGTEYDPWKLDEISLGYWDSNGEFQLTLEKLFGINLKNAILLRTVRVGDYILYPCNAGSKMMRLAYHQGKMLLFDEEAMQSEKINIGGAITFDPNWILTGGMGTKNNPWVIRL